MLNAVWGFIVAMLRLGWLTFTWRSKPSDIPYASERVAKSLAWLTYLVTYTLSYLGSLNHFAAAIMALGAWLTLMPVRRRYGPSVCASTACLLIVFVIGFTAIIIAVPAGSTVKVYVYCGWIAVYYIATVRLLRQKPRKATTPEIR